MTSMGNLAGEGGQDHIVWSFGVDDDDKDGNECDG